MSSSPPSSWSPGTASLPPPSNHHNRSFLDKLSDYYYHADIISRVGCLAPTSYLSILSPTSFLRKLSCCNCCQPRVSCPGKPIDDPADGIGGRLGLCSSQPEGALSLIETRHIICLPSGCSGARAVPAYENRCPVVSFRLLQKAQGSTAS